MNKTTTTPFIAAAVLTLGALSGHAALAQQAPTKVYDGNTLIGLNGVTVGTGVYDMRMAINTSCTSTFSGCDSVSDFTFTSEAQALAASNALLGALSLSDFRLDPLPQNGVKFMTPYALTSNVYAPLSYAIAVISTYGSVATAGPTTMPYTNFGSNEYGIQAFTVWTLTGSVPAVPEPSTYALMAAGLGAVGLIARRRRAR